MIKTNTIEQTVEYMIKYINTYKDQFGWKEYTHETFLDDMIYGIGVAMSDQYKMAQGYEKFRADIDEYFKERYRSMKSSGETK